MIDDLDLKRYGDDAMLEMAETYDTLARQVRDLPKE
jgi:hypothetical protein